MRGLDGWMDDWRVGCVGGLGRLIVWMAWMGRWVRQLDRKGVGWRVGWMDGWVKCVNGLNGLVGWIGGLAGCMGWTGRWVGSVEWDGRWIGLLAGLNELDGLIGGLQSVGLMDRWVGWIDGLDRWMDGWMSGCHDEPYKILKAELCFTIKFNLISMFVLPRLRINNTIHV